MFKFLNQCNLKIGHKKFKINGGKKTSIYKIWIISTENQIIDSKIAFGKLMNYNNTLIK